MSENNAYEQQQRAAAYIFWIGITIGILIGWGIWG